MNYIPINDKEDFIELDCIFQIAGVLYACSGVIHDEEYVYGYNVSMVDPKEHKFKFSEVGLIYKPYDPKI